MQTAINLLLAGITLGAIYALMAVGLTLVYGITRVFNYAQGSFFTWGGYIAWFLLNRWDINYLAVVLVTLMMMFALGVGFERLIVRPVRRQPEWDLVVIIVTLGCALFMDSLALGVFGPLSKRLPTLLEGTIQFGAFAMGKHDLLVLGAALVVLLGLEAFLGRTRQGMAMRAVSQDTVGAKVVGLPVDVLYGVSFGVATALAGLAAILLTPRTLIYPLVGWTTLMKAFTVMVLGGLGNVKGTVIAAFILAIIEVVATYFFGGIWALPIFIVLLIVLLQVKPKGLFGTW